MIFLSRFYSFHSWYFSRALLYMHLQHMPLGFVAFLSSQPVKFLEGGDAEWKLNTCVQLRSYRAFKISISWRWEGENHGEAIWASRRYFGACWMWANERQLGIEFNCDWVRHLVWHFNIHYLPGCIWPLQWAVRELLSHLTVKDT